MGWRSCVVGRVRFFGVFVFIEEDAHGGCIEVIELAIFGGPNEEADSRGREKQGKGEDKVKRFHEAGSFRWIASR